MFFGRIRCKRIDHSKNRDMFSSTFFHLRIFAFSFSFFGIAFILEPGTLAVMNEGHEKNLLVAIPNFQRLFLDIITRPYSRQQLCYN